MKIEKAFKYCPLCKGNFTKKEDQNFLECSSCKFKYFINPIGCNGVIIENEHNEILLVKRRFAPKKGCWDLPGGFMDAGETVEESVIREIQEELGVIPYNISIIGAVTDVYRYQGLDFPTLGITVKAHINSQQKLQTHDDISSFAFFKKEEILNQNLAFKSLKKILSSYISNKPII